MHTKTDSTEFEKSFSHDLAHFRSSAALFSRKIKVLQGPVVQN